MSRTIALLTGAVLFATAMTGPAFAQSSPIATVLAKVEAMSLSTGYRTSKVVGSTVVNEANETVGTIDDLIITPLDKTPFAVLSVGGFLGMGTKYVVVSYGAFTMRNNKMTLPGATKESLMALPEYKYPS